MVPTLPVEMGRPLWFCVTAFLLLFLALLSLRAQLERQRWRIDGLYLRPGRSLMRHLRLTIVCLLLLAPVAAAAQPQPSPDEFVPISEVPPEEQIPAITLVATAYGLVWVAVLGYVWSLGRRLHAAEREIARLEGKDR